MDKNHTEICMIQLEQVVRVAALPAHRQIESFPAGVVVADEIALDFDNWCGWALQGVAAPVLTDEQRSSLVSLDSRFDKMSSEHDAELWTDDALQCRREWDIVRADAHRILNAFGWSIDEGERQDR